MTERRPDRVAGLPWPLVLTLSLAAVALAAPGVSFATHGNARKAKLDRRLERTPVIIRSNYRALPPIGGRGAMGENLRSPSGFKIDDQAAGDLYVRAGIVRDKPRLIKRGFRAFDYAFRRQRGNGRIGHHEADEYGFFVEAVAHSVLLLRQSQYRARYKRKRSAYVRRLRRAAPHMITAEAWSLFKQRVQSYTHRAYRVGAALTMTARLTRRAKFRKFGRAAIRMGLKKQRRNGVNPELGGYDVRYHMVGIVYAERFTVYFPKGKLTRRVRKMTARGLAWMSRRVSPEGYIQWEGSTRTCIEPNSRGKRKSPGYSNTIRGFGYWAALTHNKRLMRQARRMNDYYQGAPRLCAKRPTTAVAPPGSSSSSSSSSSQRSSRGGGTLSGVQLQDVLDNYEP